VGVLERSERKPGASSGATVGSSLHVFFGAHLQSGALGRKPEGEAWRRRETGIHDEVVVWARAQLARVGGEAARDKNRAAERGGDTASSETRA
jgi:hypothetical protein